MAARNQAKRAEPTIDNRKARHRFLISETLECGLKLRGTEAKSVRDGKVSLAEGYVRAEENPPRLTLHGVHIGEYPPAGPAAQHDPTRVRVLLAHRREIRKLADKTREKGVTLVPLKLYFVRGRVKLLIGLGRGKRKADKRQDLAKKEAKRDIDRAMSKKR
jgi:SsrA-binding protein